VQRVSGIIPASIAVFLHYCDIDTFL